MTERTPSEPTSFEPGAEPTYPDSYSGTPTGADDVDSFPTAGATYTSTPEYGSTASSYTGSTSSTSSTTDTAKEQAAQLKDTAGSAAQDVAGTAKDQAQQVAGTAKDQAQQVAGEVGQRGRDLLSQASSQLSDQAGHQQQRLADSLTGYAGELRSMASNSDQTGPVTDLVHQAADRGERVAGWLSNREPRELLDDVSNFARRRPVAFLAIAAGAGLLVGRFSRGLFAEAKGGDPALSSNDATWTNGGRSSSSDRPSASLQEIPTSGTYAGPSYDDPINDPNRLGTGYSPGYTGAAVPETGGYAAGGVGSADYPTAGPEHAAGPADGDLRR